MIWIWITTFMITKEAEDDKISSDSEFQASVLSIVRVMIERRKVLESRSEQELQEYYLNLFPVDHSSLIILPFRMLSLLH